MTQGKIIGCSYGGFWYYPPGQGLSYEFQREWYDTKAEAEAAREARKAKVRADIERLQSYLEAI